MKGAFSQKEGIQFSGGKRRSLGEWPELVTCVASAMGSGEMQETAEMTSGQI